MIYFVPKSILRKSIAKGGEIFNMKSLTKIGLLAISLVVLLGLATGGVDARRSSYSFPAPSSNYEAVDPSLIPAECAGMTFDRMYVGTAGVDTITGSSTRDLILGKGGNDILEGSSGHDCIVGGAGDDKITDASGNDVILGNGGNDTIDAGSGNDYVDAGAGIDYVFGSSGYDTCKHAETKVMCEYN